MKQRTRLPQQLKEALMLEVGLKCPVPRCEITSGLDIHHIDLDRENNTSENLIVLCAVHHRMAHSGPLSVNMCRAIKDFLIRESLFSPTFVERLASREEYLQTAIRELSETKRTYRAIYVGPLFLHPTWYYHARDRVTMLPNYDVHVRNLVLNLRAGQRNSTRFILRNSSRYRQKVDQILRPRDRRRFVDEVLSSIDSLWGKQGRKGPLLCCVETGFLRIPIIHDKSVLIATRESPDSAIEGGFLYSDEKEVLRERQRYDSVFENCFRGMSVEVDELRNFVSTLF